ncbi:MULTISPECIES: DUF3809 family protein [Thermus]|uniref:DUF3809 family protein n=1 Tax=Thermus sp. (strain 2.9) TaxID=1577051 RepID=UPI000543BD56|nr:DUF3809 family protein [Thermus sp. 2.9]KHG65164.1 hypothetical protein QT17_08420 [Thermus sp. 2.9]
MKARLQLHLNGSLPQGLPLEVHLHGRELRGVLRQENPVLGELVLPFASRLEGERLMALPLPPPSLRVEGQAHRVQEGWELELELTLVLPEGRSWGEKAFAKILEALFHRYLERALSPQAPSPV